MHEAVNAIAGCGASPIVRIPANEQWMWKRALDTGAHAVMVPLISTAEDAKKAVKFAKFPPRGVRGFGSPFPMGTFGNMDLSATEYLQQSNESLLTIVQIETKEALGNVEEIAAVDGIDVLFVGPFDLGNSIGYPVTSATLHPKLQEAIQKILDAANGARKKAGIYCSLGGEQAKMYSQQGFHMISVATDMSVLPMGMTGALKAAKGE